MGLSAPILLSKLTSAKEGAGDLTYPRPPETLNSQPSRKMHFDFWIPFPVGGGIPVRSGCRVGLLSGENSFFAPNLFFASSSQLSALSLGILSPKIISLNFVPVTR